MDNDKLHYKNGGLRNNKCNRRIKQVNSEGLTELT